MTVPYRVPVRMNTPQGLDYTFRNHLKAVIPLTPYVSVSVQLKLEGVVQTTVPAAFDNPALGTVVKDEYIFTTPGIWQAQFFCVDGNNKQLWGEPLQFRVVQNEEDVTPGNDDFLKY